jgi:hypothetical protein
MGDFSDEELIDELNFRGYSVIDVTKDGNDDNGGVLLDKIYHARRQGKPYDHLLDQYLYEVTGRVV